MFTHTWKEKKKFTWMTPTTTTTTTSCVEMFPINNNNKNGSKPEIKITRIWIREKKIQLIFFIYIYQEYCICTMNGENSAWHIQNFQTQTVHTS